MLMNKKNIYIYKRVKVKKKRMKFKNKNSSGEFERHIFYRWFKYLSGFHVTIRQITKFQPFFTNFSHDWQKFDNEHLYW